jgi:integrase
MRPPAAGRVTYWDAAMPSFGLRVTDKGAQSFIMQYRPRGGVSKRITLKGKLSLKQARGEAKRLLADIADGRDPAPAGQQDEQQTQQAAETGTLRAVVEGYFKREGGRLRTAEDRKDALDRLVLPRLGDIQATEITRAMIVALLDNIEDENGPSMATHVLAYLRRVLRWHQKRTDNFVSPIVAGMARTSPTKTRGQRVLDDAEIQAVWQAAEDYPSAFNRMAQFILATGTRRNEAAKAGRSEITERDGLPEFVIPAERYKTDRTLIVPLSSLAREVLGRTPEIGRRWVFTTDGKNAIAGFSKAKVALHKAALAILQRDNPDATFPRWGLHDLRRTARTLMSRAKVPYDIGERCIGHARDPMNETYDRFKYIDERREAFEMLAQLLKRIIDPHANVVEFTKKTRKKRKGA